MGGLTVAVRTRARRGGRRSLVRASSRVDRRRRCPPYAAPGSHVDVDVAPGLVRQYSLCGDPREADRYVIAVKREAGVARRVDRVCTSGCAPATGLVVERAAEQLRAGPEAARPPPAASPAASGSRRCSAMARHLLADGRVVPAGLLQPVDRAHGVPRRACPRPEYRGARGVPLRAGARAGPRLPAAAACGCGRQGGTCTCAGRGPFMDLVETTAAPTWAAGRRASSSTSRPTLTALAGPSAEASW